MQEYFHERVKRLREAQGWSLAKLSKRSGLGEVLLTEIETNPNHVPTWFTISKLASALHINPYYLSSGEGSDKPFPIPWADVDAETYSRQTRRRFFE